MDRVLKSGLIERGWAVHEADRVVAQETPTTIRVWEGFLFYGIMAIAIFANFVISLLLIPILMVVTKAYLIFALFFVGLAFGMFLEAIIKETERFPASRLLIPELFIPSIALINVYIATQFANRVATMLLLSTPLKNPLLTSSIYVIAFMIPHFWRKFKKRQTQASV